jgi:hypothetical protein
MYQLVLIKDMQHISRVAGTIFLNTIYKKFALQSVNDFLFIYKAQLPEEHSTTLSKKYPTLGQENKVLYLGGYNT